MYVRNTAGYNFLFNYKNTTIYIPYDGKIYSVPDDIGKFNELSVIMPIHIKSQEVTYINKTGKVASPNILGHKRRGRPFKPKVRSRYSIINRKRKIEAEKLRKQVNKKNAKSSVDVDVSTLLDSVVDTQYINTADSVAVVDTTELVSKKTTEPKNEESKVRKKRVTKPKA